MRFTGLINYLGSWWGALCHHRLSAIQGLRSKQERLERKKTKLQAPALASEDDRERPKQPLTGIGLDGCHANFFKAVIVTSQFASDFWDQQSVLAIRILLQEWLEEVGNTTRPDDTSRTPDGETGF